MLRGHPRHRGAGNHVPRRRPRPEFKLRLRHQPAVGDHAGKVLGVADAGRVEFERELLPALELLRERFHIADLHAEERLLRPMPQEDPFHRCAALALQSRHHVCEVHEPASFAGGDLWRASRWRRGLGHMPGLLIDSPRGDAGQ